MFSHLFTNCYLSVLLVWKGTKIGFEFRKIALEKVLQHTLPTAEMLSGKKVRAWVSMVLSLKK